MVQSYPAGVQVCRSSDSRKHSFLPALGNLAQERVQHKSRGKFGGDDGLHDSTQFGYRPLRQVLSESHSTTCRPGCFRSNGVGVRAYRAWTLVFQTKEL